MKHLYTVIFIGFSLFISACAPEYKPDANLRQAWTPELDMTGHPVSPPYALEYLEGNKRLIYLALAHNEKPQSTIDFIVSNHRPNIILAGFENPSLSYEFLLTHGYTHQDIMCCSIIDILNQVMLKKLKSEKDLFKATAQIIQDLKTRHAFFKDVPCDIKILKNWFKDKMHKPLTVKTLKEPSLVAPITGPKATYLQRTSALSIEAEDKILYQALEHNLNKSEVQTLLVIRPAGHFIQEKNVLSAMMKVEPRVLSLKD